jgi:hypothetical protein
MPKTGLFDFEGPSLHKRKTAQKIVHIRTPAMCDIAQKSTDTL